MGSVTPPDEEFTQAREEKANKGTLTSLCSNLVAKEQEGEPG